MPRVESRVLYVDHIAERGVDLFREACRRDLEGIVAKLGTRTVPDRWPPHVVAEDQNHGILAADGSELFERRGERIQLY